MRHHLEDPNPLLSVGKVFLIFLISGFLLAFNESKIPAILALIFFTWFFFT